MSNCLSLCYRHYSRCEVVVCQSSRKAQPDHVILLASQFVSLLVSLAQVFRQFLQIILILVKLWQSCSLHANCDELTSICNALCKLSHEIDMRRSLPQRSEMNHDLLDMAAKISWGLRAKIVFCWMQNREPHQQMLQKPRQCGLDV